MSRSSRVRDLNGPASTRGGARDDSRLRESARGTSSSARQSRRGARRRREIELPSRLRGEEQLENLSRTWPASGGAVVLLTTTIRLEAERERLAGDELVCGIALRPRRPQDHPVDPYEDAPTSAPNRVAGGVDDLMLVPCQATTCLCEDGDASSFSGRRTSPLLDSLVSRKVRLRNRWSTSVVLP